MRCAIFDVDGTLVDSAAADAACIEGIRAVFGRIPIDEDWASYAAVTCERVLDDIVKRALGRIVSSPESREVQSRILKLLSAAPLAAVPGAAPFLKLLAASGWAVAIATGDWESSARYKLARAGIGTQAIPTASCDDGDSRVAIMRCALKRAEEANNRVVFERVMYFGDGTSDLRAARELGWGFVGIGSGASAAALRAQGAKNVLPDYRDSDSLLDVLRA